MLIYRSTNVPISRIQAWQFRSAKTNGGNLSFSWQKAFLHLAHVFVDREGFKGDKRKVAVNRGRGHNEIRRVFATERIHVADAGIVIVVRGSLFRTTWKRHQPAKVTPCVRARGLGERGLNIRRRLSRARAACRRVWHTAEPYFARSLVRSRTITWGPRPSCNPTRRDTVRHDAILLAGAPRQNWDFVGV